MICVALGLLGWTFISVFLLANASVQASIIAALFGIVSLVFAYWSERARAVREAHRDKKIEVYTIFYDFIFNLLKNVKNGDNVDLENDPEFQSKWFDLTRGVLFYGSPNVVQAFAGFRDPNMTKDNPDPTLVLRKIGRILLSMRADIGLSNSGLDELSIHQIYVTDDIKTMGFKK